MLDMPTNLSIELVQDEVHLMWEGPDVLDGINVLSLATTQSALVPIASSLAVTAPL